MDTLCGMVRGGRGRRIFVCLAVMLAWPATVPAEDPAGIVFEAVFDLRDASDPRLVSSEAATVKWEADGTMYWAPRDRNRPAVVVYRIDLPAPVEAIVDSSVGVAAYNRNHEHGQAYDPGCSAELEVSVDGIAWLPLQASFPDAPREDRDLGDVPELVGARSLYLRARLRTTKSHPRDRYRYAQFLRSHPDREGLQRIRFVLRDGAGPRPIVAEDPVTDRWEGKEKTPWQGMPRGR